MKKRILLLAAAVAMLFSFSACEGLDLDFIENSNIAGHIYLYTSNATDGTNGVSQLYRSNDTVKFKSVLCDVTTDETITDNNGHTIELPLATIIVGTSQNILTDGAETITFPFIGLNLRDTIEKTYNMSLPANNASFYEYLYETGWSNIVTDGDSTMGNMFVIACSEDAFYVCFDGSITLTHFGAPGETVDGSLIASAVYVTTQQLEAIHNMSESDRNALNFETYFPRINLTGEIAARRANTTMILEALDKYDVDLDEYHK